MSTSVNPVLFKLKRLALDNAALLLINTQTRLLLGIITSAPIELKSNILALAQLGKTFDLPTILTASGPSGPYMPEVLAVFPEQEVQSRTLVNAWYDPEFVAAVAKTGREKLIIAGITTGVCLLFSAIQSVKDGYDVYAMTDASGCTNAQTETAAIQRMAQAGAKEVGWSTVAGELNRNWSWPKAQTID